VGFVNESEFPITIKTPLKNFEEDKNIASCDTISGSLQVATFLQIFSLFLG